MIWSVKDETSAQPEVQAHPHGRDSVEKRYFVARAHSFLLNALALLSPFTFWTVFKHLPGYLEADHRLAPSFALIHGYRVYYPADSGPVLSTIYGPVTGLFYLPTTVAPTPAVAFVFGTAITLGLVYATALLAIKAAAGQIWMKNWQLFGLLASVFTLFEALHSASSHIHADAPALGFAAIAAVFAMRERSNAAVNAILSGLFAVLSVFSKQNMLPLLFALAMWWAVCGGWKRALHFTVSALGTSAVLLAITVRFLGSAEAFYFNCVYIPLHQPFDRTQFLPVLQNYTILAALLLTIPCVRLMRSWEQFEGGAREFLVSHRSVLLVAIGVAMGPAAVLGRLKVGGNENSLALALFFFALATMTELSALRFQTLLDISWIDDARICSLPLIGAGLVALVSSAYLVVRQPPPPSSVQRAFEYELRHPGKVYFPQFPLVHLMAEGQLYHFSWGLTDRRNAGVRVSTAQFAVGLPANARIAAVTHFVPHYDVDMMERMGPRTTELQDAGELPGFEFYELRR